MKTLQKFKYAVAAMAVAFVAACAVEPVSDVETQAAENPDYAIIRSLGMSTEGIVETEDLYIVEGDIVFQKSLMQGYASKTRQKYMRLISPSNVSNIKVYINPELQTNAGGGATWYQATVEALQEWSSRNRIPNCIINYTAVASAAQANVVVRRNSAVNSGKPTRIAWAGYPSSGNPGGYVEIGFNHDLFTAAQKKYVMVHEFGHNLGYAHMDENKGSQIPGTPTSEPQSVMASTSIGGRSWNDNGYTNNADGFTPGDVLAAQATYGNIWSHSITGLELCMFSEPTTYTLSFSSSPPPNHTVSWYIDYVLKQSGSSLNFTTTFTSPGQQHIIRAEITSGTITHETSKTIHVSSTPRTPYVAASTDEWTSSTVDAQFYVTNLQLRPTHKEEPVSKCFETGSSLCLRTGRGQPLYFTGSVERG